MGLRRLWKLARAIGFSCVELGAVLRGSSGLRERQTRHGGGNQTPLDAVEDR